MTNNDVYLCDIDGTLANLEHRRHFIRNGNKDWKAFLSSAYKDTPIVAVVKTIQCLAQQYPIICSTGRNEDYRELTEDWLRAHNVPYSELYMRPSNDFRADHVVKQEILNVIRNKYNIIAAFDDRASVVQMLRQNNVHVFQCSDWDETKAQAGVRFDIMVGPSGSGKSTFIGKTYDPSWVISTDKIRSTLCGDFRDQSRNDDVYAAAHALIKTRLNHGLNTVFDATNLRRKDRVTAAQLGLPNAVVRYMVINRPMPIKYEQGGWRNDLNIDLIKKHEMTFQSQFTDIMKGDYLDVEVVNMIET